MNTKDNLKGIRSLRGTSNWPIGGEGTMSDMNESTQDIAYRRRIILDALVNSDEVSLAKFDEVVSCSDNVKLTPIRSKKDFLNSPPRRMSALSLDPKFKPKWEDYDVMKHRWSYLRPQTKRLSSSRCHITPDSSDSTVVSLNCSNGSRKSLNGRVNDIKKFEGVVDQMKLYVKTREPYSNEHGAGI